jgi:hypothetical protein
MFTFICSPSSLYDLLVTLEDRRYRVVPRGLRVLVMVYDD